MKAVILSAGRGKRLLPLTETRPKCLLQVAGKSVLEWQVQMLSRSGVGRITVVTGFGAELVEETLAAQDLPGTEIRTLFNPRFDVADNLISCWSARDEMDCDFILLNGDTLFEPAVAARLLAGARAPVNVTVCSKRFYDADDMKVQCDAGVLRQIGKGLAPAETDAESIGMLLFRGDGPRLFREALDRAVTSAQAVRQWYLSVVNDMAAEGIVGVVPIDGLEWAEIDYIRDLQIAEQMVGAWQNDEAFPAARPAAWPV